MESPDDTLRKMVYELSYYEAQAKDLQRQVELLQSALDETVATQGAIRGLQGAVKPVLFPLGSRVFVAAKVEDKKKLLATVGSGVMMEKTYDEALANLDDNVKQIREGINRAQQQLMEISRRSNELNATVEELAKKVGPKRQ
jgi:prefoldin alpha subunit